MSGPPRTLEGTLRCYPIPAARTAPLYARCWCGWYLEVPSRRSAKREQNLHVRRVRESLRRAA